MTVTTALVAILLIAAAVGGASYLRAVRLRRQSRLHSLPIYHGVHAVLWSIAPALLVLAAWAPLETRLVDQAVLATPEARALPASPSQRAQILSEARQIAHREIVGGFSPLSRPLAPRILDSERDYGLLGVAAALLAALAGAAFQIYQSRRRAAEFRARASVEKWMNALLLTASLIAIFTTLGIILTLLFESLRFFDLVPPGDFLFGAQWSPPAASQPASSGAFGSIPLFWGTIFIGAIIAMIVAIPLGLMSAIYLTQYANPKLRALLKPLLEILAGVPTVVYGYFAALTIGPAVRSLGLTLGLHASSESALAAGLVMGIMIIPFVSSMADDSIAAVPSAMRDGSLALGATGSETIRQVLLPAALPGVVGGILLAVSRAIGETMIVVMAAGLAANLTANPFASVTTVTVQIVQLLTGDQEFDSAKTLAAFALGLVLFLITLALNLVALTVVRRYREAYE